MNKKVKMKSKRTNS